jgi:RND family efflux transporter MFP subunit
MKKYKILLSCISILCVIYYSGCNSSKDSDSTNSAVNVEIQKATYEDGSHAIAYSGTIEESETIPLTFSSIGTVSRVLVKEGDYVHRGQLLAELNNETAKNMYESALATQKQAEDGYRRLQPMYKNGNLPEVKFVEIETQLQQAKSMAATAKKNLDDCRLYATTDGVVGKRSIDPGMSAMPNIASITIVKIEKVFARVPVSENEIASVKKGQKAAITISALGGSSFTGTVEEIGVMADPLAHTYKIKIGIVNKDRQIKPGMICNVNIANGGGSHSIVVPNRAIMADETGRNFVFSVNVSTNRATRKYVTTGNYLTDGIEIKDGLGENESIVVTGQHKLVDGSKVNILNR